jgi:hypothetical protein
MRSFQSKFMTALEDAAQSINPKWELVQVANYSNTGTLYVQAIDSFIVLITVSYDFQSGKSKIEFNPSLTGALTPIEDRFYFGANETAKIRACLARFIVLLRQKKELVA